jgi:hypothetical protein
LVAGSDKNRYFKSFAKFGLEFQEAEMVRRFLAVLVIVIGVGACTTSQQKETPKFNFSKGTRVGIVNILESYATHKHFSSIRVGSFTKTYEVDWDMPSTIEDELTTQLQKDPRFTIVKIRSSESFAQKMQSLNMIEKILRSQTVPDEAARLLGTISDPYDVQILILIGSYDGISPYKLGKEPINLQGYGLFTRMPLPGIFGSILPFKNAYAYAQIGIVVFKAQPLGYIAAGKPSLKTRPLRDFNWKTDLKNLAKSELDKTKPQIQKYAKQSVERALKNANLILSKF